MNQIPANKNRENKAISISLIVLSFLLYAIMPFNVCLPFSMCIIATITGSMMIISEIVFWIGSLMIGREVAKKIRKKVSIKKTINCIKQKRR